MILLNNIKRIVVFGCSYCTGEEILYHELNEELHKLYRNTSSDPRIFFDKIEKDNLVQDLCAIQKKQMCLAWPKKLSIMLGIECLNLAQSGNSMQKMLWQLLSQYNQGNILETDLVLVAQTKAERGLYFKESPMSFQISTANGPALSKLLGISSSGGVTQVMGEKLDSAIMHWFNDDRISWDFLMVLNCLAYWKNKINLFMVPAMCLSNSDLQIYNRNLFAFLQNDLNHANLYISQKGLDDFSTSDTDYLPWGHPKEEIHQKYALHLAEVINDRFSI